MNSGISADFGARSFLGDTVNNDLYAIGASGPSGAFVAQIYKSSDLGLNWSLHPVTGFGGFTWNFTAGVQQGTNFFVVSNNGGGGLSKVFKSPNTLNWTLASNGLPDDFHPRDFVGKSESEIYVLGKHNSLGVQVYSSFDQGANWSLVAATGFSDHSNDVVSSIYTGSKMLMSVDSFPGVIQAIYTSLDGINWTQSDNGIPTTFRVQDFILVEPNIVWAVGNGLDSLWTDYIPGIYESTNGGGSWSLLTSSGLGTYDNFFYGSEGLGGYQFLSCYDSTYNYAIFRSDQYLSNIATTKDNISRIHPNPVRDILTFDVNVETDILVMDVLGHIIMTLCKVSGTQKLDFSDFPNGIYFIKTSKGASVKKIVKSTSQ